LTRKLLLVVDDEHEPVKLPDADDLADVGPGLAPCSPEFPLKAHLTARPALLDDLCLGSDQRFGSNLRSPTLREPDPEQRLGDLDNSGNRDGNDAPRRGQHEKRQGEGDDERHGGSG
jgi:hypothetical protein